MTENALAFLLVAVLVSALFTKWLGVHLIFGVFLLGIVMPKDDKFVTYIHARFETLTLSLLLPLFLAHTGLPTNLSFLHATRMWAYCVLIIAVATLGKFGATLVSSRLLGLPWADAVGLGALLNARGLMELIILNVGLDAHLIAADLFSMMVIMALATTFAATPVLRLVYCETSEPGPAVYAAS